MGYYSHLKGKKKILKHSTMWMNLEDIMLSKTSQSPKDIIWFYSHEVPRRINFIETKSRVVGARGWRKGNGNRVLVW